MGKLLILNLIISIMYNCILCQHVNVKYGVIDIDPPTNCIFTINNTEIRTLDGKIPGIHYGLIKYDCLNKIGYLLSKPECYDCGLYCPQNDNIIKCKQFTLPFILGFLISLISSIICVFIMHRWGFNFINFIFLSLKTQRKQKREIKLRKILKKISNDNDKNEYIEVIKPILERETNTAGNDQIYIPNNNPNPYTSDNTRTNSIYPGLMKIAAATMVLSSDRSFACDQTLFMHSNGQICDKIKCQDINSYTFNIRPGSSICFNTPQREMMTFMIEDTYINYRYGMMYETSDFDISLEHQSRCKQSGECYPEFCYKGARHDGFKNVSGLNGYDCNAEGLGCEFMCYHKYACTWIHWWFNEIGQRAYVYKTINNYWSIVIKVTFKNIIKRYSFNSFMPQKDLDIGKLFYSNNFPITINNIIYPNNHKDRYLIHDFNEYFEITASELNFPISGQIGDYQISLNNENRKYQINDVNCYTTGCKPICSTMEPGLRTFRATKYKNNVSKVKLLQNNQLITSTLESMTASISIGNVEFKNLFVEPASCDVDIIKTFGCLGCNKLPYAVIQASNIKNHGLLSFTSNCSFNTNFLSCNEEMYTIVPSSAEKICTIHIESINKTINLNFTYEFLGDLSSSKSLYSTDTTFSEIVNSMISNESFIDSISIGLFTFTGIGLIISLLFKIITRAILLKKLNSSKDDNNIELREVA